MSLNRRRENGTWRWSALNLAVAAGVLCGCQKYIEKPLASDRVLSSVEAERCFSSPTGTPFTFARAAELLARHGPALKEAKAAYETTLAVAKIKTPLPNPAFEIGPNFGFGSALDSRRIQPFGSIGFAVPTGGRLRDQDNWNQSMADAARIEWVLRHRESFLALRERYVRLVLAYRRHRDAQDLLERDMESTEMARSWAAAGQIPALDASLLAAQAQKARIAKAGAQRNLVEAEASLAALLGVHPDHFLQLPSSPLPEIPTAPPDRVDLKKLLVTHHPDLARLRARYAVAERDLRLQIARQTPDFKFGPAYSGEVGEDKQIVGLSLGIDIPLFDRNQQGIAEAEGRRGEIRVQYEATLSRLLAAVEEARRSWEPAAEMRRVAVDVHLPHTQKNTDLARRSVAAGIASPLQLLEAQQVAREALANASVAAQEAWTAFFQLEQAVGCPLFLFPDEPGNLAPPVPFNEEGRSK